MNLYYILILALQSGIQAFFFSRYLPRRPYLFAIFFFFFSCVLFPIDQMIPFEFAFVRNVANVFLLFVLCRWLYRDLPLSSLLIAIALYWFPLPLSEVVVILFTYFFFGGPSISVLTSTITTPQSPEYLTQVFLLQLVTTVLLGLFYQLILSLRQKMQGETIKAYISGLGAILSCMAFVSISLCYPQESHMDGIALLLPIACLIGLNALFVTALHRYVQARTRSQAQALIQEAYRHQLETMHSTRISRRQLRRFRHDLINALEQENRQGGSQAQSPFKRKKRPASVAGADDENRTIQKGEGNRENRTDSLR